MARCRRPGVRSDQRSQASSLEFAEFDTAVFVQAALNRDYTLVMGTVVVIALFTIVFNLIVDIMYAVVDPRVRYD